jgi:transposase
VEVGEPERHQVTELPEIRAYVTEYRLHTQCCPACEWATGATLPPGAPTTSFGPRLQAVVALSSGVYRHSKRTTVSWLSDLFGVALSLGSVTACEQRTSEVLAAPVEEARQHVEQQAVVYADETGWREARGRAWVWVAVTRWVTIFLVHRRRNTQAARELLGQFGGVLVSDRWRAYDSWSLSMRQLCWAHLKRYFTAFSECRGPAREIGQRLLALNKDMFRQWHRVRDGTLARSTFRAYMRPIRAEVERLLNEGTRCGHPKVEGTCRDILELASALWTFTRVPGVEPTNNIAERALRFCVVLRKTSFGTHSEAGSRFLERMLTVNATLRQQRRNVVDYVTDACERALFGRKAPSLLPNKRVLQRALATAA